MDKTSIINFLIDLFKSAVVGTVAALFTLKVALKKFRSEKWWEKQADVYHKLIDSLGEFRQSIANIAGVLESKPSEDRERAFVIALNRLKEAGETVDKYISSSGFLISSEAQPILREVQRTFISRPLNKVLELKNDNADIEEIHKILKPIYTLISEQNDKLKEIAKKNLKIV
jgi:hypothetical protein